MKRLLSILLAILMAFMFLSCEPEPEPPEMVSVVLNVLPDKVQTVEVEKGSRYTIPDQTEEGRSVKYVYDGAGAKYEVGDKIAASSNLNLTYMWDKAKLTIHAREGEVSTKLVETEKEIKLTKYDNDGYSLRYLKDESGKQYSVLAGDTITFTKDTVLTCVWDKDHVITVIDTDNTKTVYHSPITDQYFEFPSIPQKLGEWSIYGRDQDGNYVSLINHRFEKDTTVKIIRSAEPYFINPETGMITGYQGNAVSELTLPDKVGGITVTGIQNFNTDKVPKVIVPSGYKTIAAWAFYKNETISEVVLSEGIETIGRNAFNKCNNLVSVNFPSSLTTIGEEAFLDTKLGSADLSKTKITVLEQKSFMTAHLGELVLPNGLTTIRKDAFIGHYENPTVVDIPGTVETVDASCFENCQPGLTLNINSKAQSDAWNPDWNKNSKGHVNYFDSVEQDIFKLQRVSTESGFGYEVVGIKDGDTTAEIVIPSEYEGVPVVAIAANTFNGNKNITKVTIPGSVSSIGDYAFANCDNLNHLVLNEGLKTIGNYAFFKTPLANVTAFPVGLESIGENAFKFSFTGNKDIVFNDGLKNIGTNAFESAEFKSIKLPESLRKIGTSAFANTQNLTSIVIPEGVTEMGIEVFYQAKGLVEITFPSTLHVIPEGCLVFCDKLVTVNFAIDELGNGAEDIDDCVFIGCSMLKNLTLPDSLLKISGSQIFEGTAIEYLVIPAKVKELNLRSFIGLTGKTIEFTSPEPPSIIASEAKPSNLNTLNLIVPKESETDYRTWAETAGFNPENVKVKTATP